MTNKSIRIGDIVRLKTGYAPQIVVGIIGDKIATAYLHPIEYIRNVLDTSTCSLDLRELYTSQNMYGARTKNDYVLAIIDGNIFGRDDSGYCRGYHKVMNIMGVYDIYKHHNIVSMIESHDIHNGITRRIYHRGKEIPLSTTTDVILDDKFYNNKGNTTMTKIGTLYKTIEGDDYGTYLATNSQGDIVLEMRDGKGQVKSFAKNAIEEVVPFTFSVRWGGDGSNNPLCHYLGTKGIVKKGDVLVSEKKFVFGIVHEVDTKVRDCSSHFRGFKLDGLTPFKSIEDDKS